MKVSDFHGTQTSKVNKDRRSCFSCTGHAHSRTTQYHQNTTKGFEFTDSNFEIKAQAKIAKGDK